MRIIKKHISYEGACALLGGWTGIDFSQFDPDENLHYVENDAIQSAVENFTRIDPDKQWTVGEIIETVGIGGDGSIRCWNP
ncbi:hypothetical protein RWE15_15415 [Virgibacillus halophilus]|uniref:Uncharacterized protein n=1 Tax=Tigheibacillus halophilus TaxID=361280 RepID=A0ABU5C8B5_9BACI|nr:hypothetical protein [Virgibacillus halophilus]